MINRRQNNFPLYYFFLLMFLLSCADKNPGHLIKYKGLEEINIKIPDSIKPLNSKIGLKEYLSKHDQNIMIVLKSDCMNCIVELDRWSEWAKSEELIRTSSIIIVIVNPMTYLVEQEISKNKYPFPVYADHNNDFIEVNELKFLEIERLLILDQNLHIAFLGSPLTFPELNKSFLKFIDK